MNGNLVGATAPAPELHKVYYYHRHAPRYYRRAYRRGYYGGYYRGSQCSDGSLNDYRVWRCTGPAHLPRFGGAFSLRRWKSVGLLQISPALTETIRL
jgi:hypothetical protein